MIHSNDIQQFQAQGYLVIPGLFSGEKFSFFSSITGTSGTYGTWIDRAGQPSLEMPAEIVNQKVFGPH